MAAAPFAMIFAGASQVGDVVPDFNATDTEGVNYRLDELLKSGPVVLAFFPKAFTSG